MSYCSKEEWWKRTREIIQDPAVLVAAEYLAATIVGSATLEPAYYTGKKHSFRFCERGTRNYDFSFLVNQGHLLFYQRHGTDQSKAKAQRFFAAKGLGAGLNNYGELTVSIHNLEQAKMVYEYFKFMM